MFTHLHLHTKYSLLDSTIKIDELIQRIKELGQTSVAITDHGNLYGVVEFYKEAIKNNIKPIIGCEVYICQDASILKRENKMYHLILLCKNEIGRLNLQKLVSESTRYKFNKRPRIDFSMLEKYHEGLICMSACMVGEVADAIRNNNNSNAVQIAQKYKKLFNDDYYIEYQAHSDDTQQNLNFKLVELAEELDIKYVVTCDSHYLVEDDQKYHDIYVKIGQARETGETYNDCYVQSEEDVLLKCKSTKKYNKQAIKTIEEIVDKCNVDYPLSAPIIPHVQIPNQYKTEAEYLKALCSQGMKQKGFFEWSEKQWRDYLTEEIVNKDGSVSIYEFIKFNNVKEILSLYKERAKYEIDAVTKMGFEGYYLLVHSYISSVKKRGIARGSAGGSLLAYLSGIVDIDPIKYGLYFERFIDVGALDLLAEGKITRQELKIPDVDGDFSTDDREKVMQFIISKYHAENVVSLGQFGYLWAKGAIKDIGKVLGIPFDITNEMTKKLNDESIDDVINGDILDKYKDQYPDLFVYVQHLAGLPKSHGMHPCGKVITMQEASYYNAVEYDKNNDVWVLEGDMHTADDLGLVKIDLLGLRTLNVIYDTLNMIGKDYNYIAPHKINFNDQLVWNEFANGNTMEIFQFESPGMRHMLKEMYCNSIENLIAANALYRPGSKNYIPNYIARKVGKEEIVYLHDDLKDILNKTYGIIVYQEQLIEIGRLAGLSNPDELRKATAKKKPKLMAKIEPEMKQGLINRGWTQEQVNQLWDDIVRFAKYSFNRSHAGAYAITAYITMYLKVHHPSEFITASINSYEGRTNDIADVVKEAQRMGVKCLFDEFYNIPATTQCIDNCVHMGINTIKGLGTNVSQDLIKLQNIPDNFIDVLAIIKDEKILDKAALESMIKLNFFKKYGGINKLIKQLEIFNILYKAKQLKIDKLKKNNIPIWIVDKHSKKKTEKMFKDFDSVAVIKDICANTTYKKTPIIDKVRYEFEYLGYSTITDERFDKEHYYVIDLPGAYKNMLSLYNLHDGHYETIKFQKNKTVSIPEPGNVIKVFERIERNKKKLDHIDEDGKKIFVDTEEREIVISKYVIIH